MIESVDASLRETIERYRAILEHTFDFVVEISADGHFLSISPGYEKALDYSPGELLGRNVFDLMHPDDVPAAVEALTRGVETRSADGAVFRYRHKRGEWRWFESSGRPFLTQSGELRAIICSRDITERRRAQEALTEELQVSSGVERVARALISLHDTPRVLHHLCRLTAKEIGCTVSVTALRESNGDRFVPIASFEEADTSLPPAPLVLSPGSRRALLERLEGEELIESSTAADDALARELTEGLGLVAGLHAALRIGGMIVGMQSTGSRRPQPFSRGQRRLAAGIAQIGCMALENARLFEQAQHANRLKSEFLATVSHELRTPLHIILGYNDLLLGGQFGPLERRQTEILRRVDRSSKELSQLIDATLDVGRLEGGQAPVDVGAVEVGTLIDDVRRETEEVRGASTVGFGWYVAEDLPMVWSDAAKLKLVLKNLVGNAIKFTERGSISVDARASDGGVAIAVTDTGIGIAPADLPHIFESFRQSSTARDRGGVGLGLYIVRRTVDLLGGTVTVDSAIGRGSTFRIWIPSTPPTMLAEPLVEPPPGRAS